MDFTTDYSDCVDWGYEADIARQDARERRERELIEELQNDPEARAEAWDLRCDELTGIEVEQYLRDGDKDALFRQVELLVKAGLRVIAHERAEKEVGRG
jgi:hypothetical protein